MIEPSLALQGAILTALKSNTVAGENVFDKVTPNTFPRIQIGGGQTLTEDAEGVQGVEIFTQVDVFSEATGYPQVKGIAWQIRDLLHRAQLTVPDWRVVSIQLQDAVYSRENDDRVSRARMTLNALMEAL